MKNGDEDNQITFSEELGLVYFTKVHKQTGVVSTRTCSIQACAWVEFDEGATKLTPEVLQASKANPEAFQKLK